MLPEKTNNNNEINNAAENITKPFERRGLNIDLNFLNILIVLGELL